MADSLTDFSNAVSQVKDHLKKELQVLRTGRASVQLVDTLWVEAYGTKMQLVELATISTPDPTLIVISPWDKSLLAAIERAIQTSDLQLSGSSDGDVVRIPVPSLTQEKRQELVKVVHRKLEEAQVMLRNARTETRKEIEATEGQGGVSEDDIHSQLEQLDKQQKTASEELEKMAGEKESALMTV